MRLIYTANARIPSEKAHPYQILQMCEAFADSGAQVTLLYANRRNPPPLRTDDPWAFYGLQRNITAERIPCLDVFPFGERLPARWRAMWWRLAAAVETFTYILALILRLRSETHAVIYSRDALSVAVPAWLWPRRARRLFFEAHTYPATGGGLRLRRWMAGRIGGVVVITEHLRQRYAGLGIPPERMLVAHDGIRVARFDIEGDRDYWRGRFGWPVETFIVGYMGRFHTLGMDKGLGDLVEAVILLAGDAADRPVRLALVGGPGEYVDGLRAHFIARGLPPDLILYTGQVPAADVPGYLRAFDVCTMPFPWTEHFAYYASPMKLFEYMASGSPVVATDLPSTAEIISDGSNGLLTPPGDSLALAEALRCLRDDPALARRLADRAAQDVQAYTWDTRARRILTFLDSVV
jgi:glycosyltransferase involved in cell wall biosynthesis